jgi:hypothetical protein
VLASFESDKARAHAISARAPRVRDTHPSCLAAHLTRRARCVCVCVCVCVCRRCSMAGGQ